VRIILAIILALGTALPAFPQDGDASPLTAEQRRLNLESLEKVWTTVRDTHWDPTLGGVDWTAAHAAALSKVRSARNMQQSRAAMSEMLAKLKQSHFAIIPSDLYKQIQPASRNRAAGEKPNAGGAPPKSTSDSATREEECGVGIEAAIIDGKARVVALEDGSPAAHAGVGLGWELVSVDGVDISQALILLAGTDVPEREMYERAILEQAFLGPLNESVETAFNDDNGQPHHLVLDRVEPKGNLVQFGYIPQTRVWIEARQLDGPIEYIHFNLFLDPEHLMPAFEKAVRDCFKCQGFVIDLRGNPGGIGPMSMGMAGWFVNRRGRRLGTLKARDYTVNFDINPRADTFDGPLAVLVDGGSASTSEIFAAGLQDLGRARVFGTKTAGAALPSEFVRLPNADGFQYAEATYTSRNGQVLEGAGVTPDVIVTHTRESLLSGRDAALDAAVKWIKSK
jgi:carboxyl-terminal processing protease